MLLIMHKPTGTLFEGIRNILGTELKDSKGRRYLQCELGPSCDFEIVGEL